MSQIESVEPTTQQWTTICPIERILPNTGVCALVNGKQIAVFRVGDGMDVYAIDNYDPFSKTYVLSRGIVGDRNGIPKVASPIYKQNFSLFLLELSRGKCRSVANQEQRKEFFGYWENEIQE
jgi:nitrite reductase (NADH) small subunit